MRFDDWGNLIDDDTDLSGNTGFAVDTEPTRAGAVSGMDTGVFANISSLHGLGGAFLTTPGGPSVAPAPGGFSTAINTSLGPQTWSPTSPASDPKTSGGGSTPGSGWSTRDTISAVTMGLDAVGEAVETGFGLAASYADAQAQRSQLAQESELRLDMLRNQLNSSASGSAENAQLRAQIAELAASMQAAPPAGTPAPFPVWAIVVGGVALAGVAGIALYAILKKK